MSYTRNWGLLVIVLLSLRLTTWIQADEKSFRVPPKEPSEALKSFRLQPGFRIELVAAEPLIRDPVAIAFDESGRMYVVEYPEFNEYSFKEKPKPVGTVKLLEDTDGDGRCDKSTLFLERVSFPTAVACYEGGVFVGAAPDLLYCKDTNGDGRADVRKKILTGFARDFAGGGLLNSFHWGLDNRIHIATSFAGGDVRRADRPEDEPVSVRSRGVIFDPRTGDFELTSGSGQHGLGIDDWGRKFLCSNVNPMQLLMYDGRYVARNPFFVPPPAAININAEGRLEMLHRISPLEPWRIERSKMVMGARPDDEGSKPGRIFTSSSGITIYRGDAWPEKYRGNLFVGEVANNLVYRAKLEPDGIGVLARRADHGSEFLASSDIWFRPVQFANAPDGNLYIVDMYRELIEGAAFVPRRILKKLDPASGTDRGRIYRIVAGKKTEVKKKKLPHKMTNEQLVALLEHSNGWHRDTASRLLYERQDRRVASALTELVNNSKSAVSRAHAMYVLDGLKRLTPEIVLGRLDDPHPDVRIHALKLSESMVGDELQLRTKLCSMTDESDPRVRYQLAFSLGEIPHNHTRQRAMYVLMLRTNQWMKTAIQSSLEHGAGEMLRAMTSDSRFRRSDEGKEFLISLAAQIGARGRSNELAQLLKALERIPEDEQMVKRAMTRGVLSNASKQVKEQFLAMDSGKLLTNLVLDARTIAMSKNAAVEDRVHAIYTMSLAKYEEVEHILFHLLQLNQPYRIQSAVLQTLVKFNHPDIPRMVHERWNSLSPASRAQALETMFTRTEWTRATLRAIEKNQIPRGDVNRFRLTLLKDHDDAAIQRLARTLLKSSSPERQKVIDAYGASLEVKGNTLRGKLIFKKSCAACHRLDGIGKSIGADLAAIGNHPAETVLTHILDPNRELKPKFVNYVLVDKDGRTVTGMILEETANSLRLVRADGTEATVLRIHIESLRSTGVSFMPDGLEREIDVQAMGDLLAYLTSS